MFMCHNVFLDEVNYTLYNRKRVGLVVFITNIMFIFGMDMKIEAWVMGMFEYTIVCDLNIIYDRLK